MLEIRQLDRSGDRVIGVLHKSESYDITETVFANLVNESNDFTVLGVYDAGAGSYIGGMMHGKAYELQGRAAAL